MNEEFVLDNLFYPSFSFSVTVPTGEPELRITLDYADPAAEVAADVHTINDLNLKVTSPSGAIFWGNCGLKDGDYSVPEPTCAGANPPHPLDPLQDPVLDTVENVFIPNPEVGDWQVEVIADDIAQDGHVAYVNNDPTECCCPGNPPYCYDCIVPSPTDADFALVVAGVTNVSGSCCMPGGRGCRDITRNACAQFGGGFNVGNTCAGGPVACPTPE